MKILQVTPKAGNKVKLKALLKDKERQLRGTATTFVRHREADIQDGFHEHSARNS
jgi:hypothetical protein